MTLIGHICTTIRFALRFQVNGKSYPQAKLLLGQMGALHPANRLAAYITGRLRPTSLELSHVTSTLSKKARAGKEPQPASREADKRVARGGQAPSPATPPRAEASAAPSLSTAAPSLSTAAPSISTGSALTVSKLGMATVGKKDELCSDGLEGLASPFPGAACCGSVFLIRCCSWSRCVLLSLGCSVFHSVKGRLVTRELPVHASFYIGKCETSCIK